MLENVAKVVFTVLFLVLSPQKLLSVVSGRLKDKALKTCTCSVWLVRPQTKLVLHFSMVGNLMIELSVYLKIYYAFPWGTTWKCVVETKKDFSVSKPFVKRWRGRELKQIF